MAIWNSQKALIILEWPVWESLQAWLWESTEKDAVNGSQLEYPVWLVSLKYLGLFARVAKSKVLRTIHFGLRKRGTIIQESWCQWLISERDLELWRGNWARRKGTWSCKIIKGMFARNPEVTWLRTSGWLVSCFLSLIAFVRLIDVGWAWVRISRFSVVAKLVSCRLQLK